MKSSVDYLYRHGSRPQRLAAGITLLFPLTLCQPLWPQTPAPEPEPATVRAALARALARQEDGATGRPGDGAKVLPLDRAVAAGAAPPPVRPATSAGTAPPDGPS